MTNPKERNWYFLVGFSSLALAAVCGEAYSLNGLLHPFFWLFTFSALLYAAGTHLWDGFDAVIATATSKWPIGLALTSSLAFLAVLVRITMRWLAMDWNVGTE